MPLSDSAALYKDRLGKSAMEHRHFATIAAILRKFGADEDTANAWADELASTNPRFDRRRFVRAVVAE